jgi:hypothetical protein
LETPRWSEEHAARDGHTTLGGVGVSQHGGYVVKKKIQVTIIILNTVFIVTENIVSWYCSEPGINGTVGA